jgi:hypothetical protein
MLAARLFGFAESEPVNFGQNVAGANGEALVTDPQLDTATTHNKSSELLAQLGVGEESRGFAE